jgi:sulfite reductase (NADPH) flavoprotein alpha-component
MDLIKRETDFFIDLLQHGGVIMICGSLAMQKDVEAILDKLCDERKIKSMLEYKNNGQLLTDCY